MHMKRMNIAAVIMGFFSGASRLVPEMATDTELGKQPFVKRSRGKSGKHTSKRSNAAQHQRDAKKRNNIRKHK